MRREIGLYGGPNYGVLEFLSSDFERRGYIPRLRRAGAFKSDQTEPFEIVGVFGLRGGAGLARDAYRAKDVPVLVADAAHLRRDAHKWHKVVWDDQHWLPPVECPGDRLDALDLEVVDRSEGEYVLVCGQKQGDSQHPFAERQDSIAWAREVVSALRQVTRRKIVWRPHPLDIYRVPEADEYSDPVEVSLADALSGAHAVVTYNSTSGLDALIAGVPVVAFGPAVYGELAECDLSVIDDLEVPSLEERRALLARVAYTQWTVEECRDGECLDFLLRVHAGEDPFAEGASAGDAAGSSAGGEEDRGVAEEQGVSAGVFAPPLPPAVVSRLVEAGYGVPETINEATDEELRSVVKGLGPKRLEALREYAEAA